LGPFPRFLDKNALVSLTGKLSALRTASPEFADFEKRPPSGASHLKTIYEPGLDNSIYNDIMIHDAVEAILGRMRRNPQNVRFKDLLRVCDHHFGPPRQRGGSHRVYKTPWPGDPRINIQNDKGMAKCYQVKQVLAAINKLEAKNEPDE
jgi:hypothetical protein